MYFKKYNLKNVILNIVELKIYTETMIKVVIGNRMTALDIRPAILLSAVRWQQSAVMLHINTSTVTTESLTLLLHTSLSFIHQIVRKKSFRKQREITSAKRKPRNNGHENKRVSFRAPYGRGGEITQVRSQITDNSDMIEGVSLTMAILAQWTENSVISSEHFHHSVTSVTFQIMCCVQQSSETEMTKHFWIKLGKYSCLSKANFICSVLIYRLL